ncbi:MAG: hypothetical protein ACJ783_13730, partial [Myxococcales bacterium]
LPAPVVAAVASGEPGSTARCLSALGDDGDATFLLGYSKESGFSIRLYHFFQIQNGSAVRVGDELSGGGDFFSDVYSQPSGFTALQRFPAGIGGSALENWSHDGVRVSSRVFAADESNSELGTSAIGVDPSGGTAAVKTFLTTDKGWITAYQRFDKTGVPETGEVRIDAGERYIFHAVGVALSGHALVVSAVGGRNGQLPRLQARWFARDGTAISQPFALQTGWPRLQFLMDGSVVLALAPTLLDPFTFVNRIEDGVAVAGPLPDWLQQRSGNQLFPVRSGKAYATWGGGGQCGSDLEVVASGSGKSCGCLKVPQLSRSTSFARDGSLIVPHLDTPGFGCAYDLYSKLLR